MTEAPRSRSAVARRTITGVAIAVLACASCSSAAHRSGATTTTAAATSTSATPATTTHPTATATPTSLPVSTTAAAAPSTTASGPAPTLGAPSTAPGQSVGYGQVRPTELYAGGDSASHLTGIHWTSWGGAQATGTVAQALWADPGQSLAQGHEETAVIVAFDLRDCGGHPGYHRLAVYFPQHGQTLASVTPTGPHFDYCTGATVTTP